MLKQSTLFAAALLVVTGVFSAVRAEDIACGTDGTIVHYGAARCYTSTGYPTAASACRAAAENLKNIFVIGVGANCLNQDCTATSCQSFIRCMDSACSKLTIGPAETDGETWKCTACWLGGDFKVGCHECEHI